MKKNILAIAVSLLVATSFFSHSSRAASDFGPSEALSLTGVTVAIVGAGAALGAATVGLPVMALAPTLTAAEAQQVVVAMAFVLGGVSGGAVASTKLGMFRQKVIEYRAQESLDYLGNPETEMDPLLAEFFGQWRATINDLNGPLSGNSLSDLELAQILVRAHQEIIKAGL